MIANLFYFMCQFLSFALPVFCWQIVKDGTTLYDVSYYYYCIICSVVPFDKCVMM